MLGFCLVWFSSFFLYQTKMGIGARASPWLWGTSATCRTSHPVQHRVTAERCHSRGVWKGKRQPILLGFCHFPAQEPKPSSFPGEWSLFSTDLPRTLLILGLCSAPVRVTIADSSLVCLDIGIVHWALTPEFLGSDVSPSVAQVAHVLQKVL